MNKFRIGDVVRVVKIISDAKEFAWAIGKEGVVLSFEDDNDPKLRYYEVGFDDCINSFWPRELELVMTNKQRLVTSYPVFSRMYVYCPKDMIGRTMGYSTEKGRTNYLQVYGYGFHLEFDPDESDILVLPAAESDDE